MKYFIILAVLLTGCNAVRNNYVITSTGTSIGLSVAQNPSTQLYEGRFGYARTELALVPTNKGTNDVIGGTGGAKDTPDVLMEFRMSGILSFNAAMYERLAIGSSAVGQPGAALMFAKDSKGNLLTNTPVIQQLLLKNPNSK